MVARHAARRWPVLITNAGWKAVAIGSGTLSDPGSLTVYSITLASPGDSHNILLFSYPGPAAPLTTRFFTVASNAAPRQTALIGSWNEGYTLAGGRHIVSGLFSIGLDSSPGCL